MIQFATKAIQLMNQGITCIPHIGKSPAVKGWPQIRNLTQEQIMEWESKGLWRNIGLLCGEASGNIVVIDFDGLAGYEMFKEKFPELVYTKTVLSGSELGMHVYFKVDLLPDSFQVMKAVVDGGELINVEIRANGMAVLIPPSIHPDSHKPYVVKIDLPMLQVPDLAKVVAWAKSLKPELEKDWQQPKTPTTYSGNLNPKLLEVVERHFLAVPHKMNDGWINCSCPDATKHKNGDVHFSFGYNPAIGYGNCFGCGDMLLKDILPLISIDSRDYGGIYEHKEQEPQTQLDRMPTEPKMEIAQPRIPPASTPVPTGKVIKVVKRSTQLSHYFQRISDPDMKVENPPIIFPITALHRLGGMAQIIKPGKLAGIIGLSGGGKTSLLETMVDGFLDDHASCLIWSPEWSGDEFVERAVQRYGGPTASEVYMHEKFISDQQRGISPSLGKELSSEQIKAASAALRMLRSWESEVGYLDDQFLTIGGLKESFAATLASLDFKPQVLVIDYLQLFHALEPNHFVTLYSMIMQIKALCGQYHMVGVLASQVTKADTKAKINKNELLDASSARYVNDDAFNLFITINPDIDKITGENMPHGVLNVAKNSMGKKGKIRVGIDWPHLSFDKEAHMYQGKLETAIDPDEEKDQYDDEEEKPKRRRKS